MPVRIVQKNKYSIKNKLEGEIIENDCNINLEDNQKVIKLEKSFSKLINQKEKALIDFLKENKRDVLEIDNKYYIKFRKKNNDYFYKTKFKITTNLKINKKGLIFEVKR